MVKDLVKGGITKLYGAKFIQHCLYPEWISNIVSVFKKNAKLQVCVDVRDQCYQIVLLIMISHDQSPLSVPCTDYVHRLD